MPRAAWPAAERCRGPRPRTSHAALFTSAGLVDLNTVVPASDGFTYSNAIGIDNAGTIVGIAVGPDGFTTRAFLLVRDDR